MSMSGLHWQWIALQLAAPSVVAGLIAYPIWLKRQPILGNLAGTAVLFASAFALIMREHIELERLAQACIDQGFYCFPKPDAFTRYAVYAFVALFEMMALFTVSLRVEHTVRRRGYDPEWR
jgi:hypothetical protein